MDEIHSAVAPHLDMPKKISGVEWLTLITIIFLGPVVALLLIVLNTIWLLYTSIVPNDSHV